jgi:hypothetical protein
MIQEELAELAEADRNYTGVDPELQCMDRFIHGTINSLQCQDEVHAFVRAGLFRSFTARKVLTMLAPDHNCATLWRYLHGSLSAATICCLSVLSFGCQACTSGWKSRICLAKTWVPLHCLPLIHQAPERPSKTLAVRCSLESCFKAF